jgi:hypothetical protein
MKIKETDDTKSSPSADVRRRDFLKTLGTVAGVGLGAALEPLLTPRTESLTLAQAPQAAVSPQQIARLEVTATSPHLATGEDATRIFIKAFDAQGRPASDADLFVALVAGEDHLEQGDVVNRADGTYTARKATTIAGWATVLVRDRHSEVGETVMVGFVPGGTTQILLSAGGLQSTNVQDRPRIGVALDATARDEFFNVVQPPDSAIEWSTTFGELSSITVDKFGISRASLSAMSPGEATVTASDQGSKASQSFAITLPAINLRCPPAIHLTGEPDEDRTLEVDVEIFSGTEPLRSYRLDLTLNELTRFAGVKSGSPDDNFPPPQAQSLAANVIQISQTVTDTKRAPSGTVRVASLVFECLGEGLSRIDVTQASLVNADGLALPDAPRLPAICPNKRVRSLCINPIIVKQMKNPADPTDMDFSPSDADKQSIIDQLADIQKNLDEGCCKILLKVRTKAGELKKPGDVKPGDLQELDADAEGVPVKKGTVGWDAREPMEAILIDDDLIEVMKKSKEKGLRDNDCINLYFVKTLGWDKDKNGNPGSTLAGADIKRMRIRMNGRTCEKQGLRKLSDPNKKLKPQEDFEGAFVAKRSFEDSNQRTIKHEVGHMLGLRHPWEYKEKFRQMVVGKDNKNGKSVMLYKNGEDNTPKRDDHPGFTQFECTLIEKDCNERLGKKPLKC